MKRFFPLIFISIFIVVFMSTWVYLMNEAYIGQYLGLLGASCIITAALMFLAWFVGILYEVLERVAGE